MKLKPLLCLLVFAVQGAGVLRAAEDFTTDSPLHRTPAAPSAVLSPEEFHEGPACDDVRRSVRLLTPQVVVGEPVVFELRLQGNPPSELPAAEYTMRMALGRDLRAFVFPPRGNPFEVTPPGTRGMSPGITYNLQRNEVVNTLYTLAADSLSANGAVTFHPGTYGLRVVIACPVPEELHGTREEILGDFLFEVLPAEGANATALSIIGRDDMVLFQGEPPRTPEQIAKLERIANEFPNAALRPYAIASLAVGLHFRGSRVGADTTLVQQSIPWFELFLREYPDHPYAPTLRYAYIQALYFVDRTDDARDEFVSMWTDPRQTLVFRSRDELRERYVGRMRAPLSGNWMIFERPLDVLKTDSHQVELEQERARMSLQEQFLEAAREAGIELSEDFEFEVRDGGTLP